LKGEIMFDRLKRVLVGSFIGVVALGYLLAIVIQYFVSAFTSPIAAWAGRNLYPGPMTQGAASLSLPLRSALSPATAFVLLLLVWYVLLRWLYFTPVKEEVSGPDFQKAA
jgi:hypothetical protein